MKLYVLYGITVRSVKFTILETPLGLNLKKIIVRNSNSRAFTTSVQTRSYVGIACNVPISMVIFCVVQVLLYTAAV